MLQGCLKSNPLSLLCHFTSRNWNKWSLSQINLYPLHKKHAGHFVVKFPVHGMTSLLMTWGSHTAYTDMEKPRRTGGTFSVEDFGLETLLWIWWPSQHLPLLEQPFVITMKLTMKKCTALAGKKQRAWLPLWASPAARKNEAGEQRQGKNPMKQDKQTKTKQTHKKNPTTSPKHTKKKEKKNQTNEPK